MDDRVARSREQVLIAVGKAYCAALQPAPPFDASRRAPLGGSPRRPACKEVDSLG